ncbi:uncharacterized protein LOC136039932 isoform X1 [Artemia franciscana]|uniref:Uncharacterized protein n=1 Tax=Artemia franciscana TaxID=6661 RepID=A0AA88HXQ1_ARTSF|nr:hypothetical protein QYM36_008644 [Artemia franciscana]KAK2714138.1 hypothetical protein QYM36_008644 [Artemia franciscana]KAK2714140.1 hypothetical protein QYM36_008644 [Artemia franciscana]
MEDKTPPESLSAPSKKVSTPRKYTAPSLCIDVSAIAPVATGKFACNASNDTQSWKSSSGGQELMSTKQSQVFSDESCEESGIGSSLSLVQEVQEMDECSVYAIYLQSVFMSKKAEQVESEKKREYEDQLLQGYSLYKEMKKELTTLADRIQILNELKLAQEDQRAVEPLLKKISDLLRNAEGALIQLNKANEALLSQIIIKGTDPIGITDINSLKDELAAFCDEMEIPRPVDDFSAFVSERKDVLIAFRNCSGSLNRITSLIDRATRLLNTKKLYSGLDSTG